MKRKTFKLFLVMCILTSICFITSCKKNKPVDETFPEIVNKLTSYKLVGTLESNFPSGTKECNVTTYNHQICIVLNYKILIRLKRK